jgi:hypothetical protein
MASNSMDDAEIFSYSSPIYEGYGDVLEPTYLASDNLQYSYYVDSSLPDFGTTESAPLSAFDPATNSVSPNNNSLDPLSTFTSTISSQNFSL